jgi:DNA-binding beta-propeller fold protein YncE
VCASCNDGNTCTADSCAAGACVHTPLGSTVTCDDGLSCTSLDHCDAGLCVGTIATSYCVIEGTCRVAGVSGDPCLACDPATSTTAWTPQSAPGCVVTLAGSAAYGFQDGPALSAKFKNPAGVALDSTGSTLYVADSANSRIRAISIATGTVSTVAGSAGYGYVDGPAATAKLKYPEGVAVDSAGTIYVADTGNQCIRAISAGVVSTVAGTNTAGMMDGAPAAARFTEPRDVAVSAAGLLVADSGNNRIRLIDIATGVTTLAGAGTLGFLDGPAGTALFGAPHSVVATPSVVYVADKKNHRIRAISAGVVSTAAGAGSGFIDGPAATAKFNYPLGVALSSTGTIVIADHSNHRVRLLNSTTGAVTTLAGSGVAGFADGSHASAKFDGPRALAVGAQHVYVADYNNHRIRVILTSSPP